MITFQQAFDYIRTHCGFDHEEGSNWSDSDLTKYETETGLVIPNQLKETLRNIGFFAVEDRDSFLVNYEDGTRSVHETQMVVYHMEHMLWARRAFATHDDTGDPRMPLPMHFFGTADGGNNHLLMDGTDPNNNTVYFWRRVDDPWGEGDNTKGLGKVADTLYEFFYNLRPYDEL